MKFLWLTLLGSVLINFSLIAQNTDTATCNKTLEPTAGYICDIARNFSGGMETGNAYMGLLHAGITIHTDRLWKGGKLVIEGMNTHGHGLSAHYLGDIQVVSNIENGDYTFIYQLLYKQYFSKGFLSVGVQDLNAEFAGSEYGAALTNSSFGIHSSFPLNFGVSIYPKPSLAIAGGYQFTDQFTFRTGIYDADAGSLEDDKYNTDWPVDEIMSISELEYNAGKTLNTTFKIGGYYLSGEYTHITDTARTYNGNYGLYLVADQKLIDSEVRGLALFGQLGYMPENRNYNILYGGIGLNLTAPFKSRKDDVFACGAAYARLFNDEYECDLEFNYCFSLCDYISIQPAFHYIIHPGADQGLDNAFAAFLRISTGF